MTVPRVALLAVILLLTTLPVCAHNGTVAIALPMEGITVDGDLSDWPEGMREYPMEMSRGRDLSSHGEDVRGTLRVGYDAGSQKLYVAVMAEDDSPVPEGQRTDLCVVEGYESHDDQRTAAVYREGVDAIARCASRVARPGEVSYIVIDGVEATDPDA